MAEMVVSLVIDQLVPLLRDEAKLLRGVHKEFADLKDELESIQAFLKDADRRAAADGDNTSEGVKTWVKQLRVAAFRIEDIIDEYMIHVGQQPRDPGCVAILDKIAHLLKTMTPRHRIAAEIQDVKSSVRGIKERSERYGFQPSFEQGSSSSRENRNAKWHDPRVAALYIEEADVVGFKAPRKRLIDWMVKGTEERTVVSVVGMGGQGKTTLAKRVFDSKDVIGHFDCHVWITVSQSYNVEGILRDMLRKLHQQKGSSPPMNISEMDRDSLTDEVRKYLRQKRYIVVFDDIWSKHFWEYFQFAVFDNKKGSRILITTRNLDVAVSKSSSIELHGLTPEESLELLNKKVFKFDCDGCCPKELIGIANDIVKKCNGLPLAIVAIGGLLSTIENSVFEWQRFREHLNSELKTNAHLIGIEKILSLSYDDLPYYLKSCLLYFGVYPEDYEVKSKRVTRQWIAEGFVKEEKGKTLDEVAEGYLTELIHRSLVQVSSLRIDGKTKGCRVHDLIRDMILAKNEDFNFCKHISDDGQTSLGGIVRRLSITTIDDVLRECIDQSHVRSLFFFGNKVISLKLLVSVEIPTKYKLLKVVDLEDVFNNIPNNLGNFTHLKYLSMHLKITIDEVPKSIGMLQNLETLVLRGFGVFELPKEIRKLRKLRHLIGYRLSLIQLKDGIGEMKSLQTLRRVSLDMDGAAEVIKALGKLKLIRDLGLVDVPKENESILSSSIKEMQQLEKLRVLNFKDDNFVDLNLISLPTMLQKLILQGPLKEFPKWMLDLQNLTVLRLAWPCSDKDPLQSLKSLQHLLSLYLDLSEYEGLQLHFQDGWFQKLKGLVVLYSSRVREIIIDKGSMPSLKILKVIKFPNLKNIPTGIQHLEKLEFIYITEVDDKIEKRSSAEDWNWIMEHVPSVTIYSNELQGVRNLALSYSRCVFSSYNLFFRY
ncbi:putative P-loop containing nucleoside triphosphate hydrolase, leucine-rich repeat domain, L [Medicago truncatula]|uniref:Putative P-loop containing nucleoside triphosphate hydrolase, leucine-rich repeat domain, L n=2 Tax=Medicago truncatula TaxID=3880 RepID=A0A396IPL8_MEDTR|nr:putative P-loop containing nucleoside triphosphate hydrolase, leucine-rich repeat domain, L [Medicago truncatula]